MSEYDKEDKECEAIQKNHGPGGELPTIGSDKIKKSKREPMDAKWEPVRSKKSDVEKVKSCVIGVTPFALASGIVFWWQQASLLEETTGFYALIALALMAGLSVGRCVEK